MKSSLYVFLNVCCVVIVIAITVLSLLPPKTGPEIENDKLGHFIAYFALTFNLMLLSKKKQQDYLFLIFALFYGLLMEFLQSFVPGRDSSVHDMLANSLGVVAGYFTVLGIRVIRAKYYS